MESRESTKLEFLKQPHIIIISILIIFVIAAAIFTAIKRISKTSELSNMQTKDACLSLIKDERLCNFAASNEINKDLQRVMTITSTADNKNEVTISELESASKHKTTTYNSDNKEVDSFIVIDESTYVKDYENSIWALYKDEEYQSSDNEIKYDFTSEISKDVTEFKENYKFENEEKCGELSCYKYKIIDNENPNNITYFWFDNKDFLIRKLTTEENESFTSTVIEYKPVSIKTPSPVKEVTLDDIKQYMEE